MNFFKWFISFFGNSNAVTTSTTTDTTTTKGNPGNSKKRALCVGINDYKGSNNDLRGCVNDANNWANLFRNRYSFDEVTIVLNKHAVKSNIKSKLQKIINKSKAGDEIVFSFSGHGTSVRDTNRDEADKKDEALCLHDSLFLDDEIRAILNKIPKGVKFTVLSDSCHSGSVTRAFLDTMSDESYYSKPRYMPPEDDQEAEAIAYLKSKKAIAYPESGMNHILISGTNASTYSYDARINGENCGAFSYYAIKILKENPNITYEDFFTKLRKELPSSRWPQKPQLEGPDSLKKSIMFK